MDGSGQKEVFGRNKKLKRVTVLVTDGKGDGRRMLIFGTFSFNVLSFELVRHLAKVEVASSSLVYRSEAEVRKTPDFRCFFDLTVTIFTITRALFYYPG